MINFDLFYSVLSCIIFLFMLAIYLTILYLLAAYSALVKLTEFLLCDATTDSLWNWPMPVISQPDWSATEGGLSKCSCFCLFLLTTLSDLLSEHLQTDLYPSCRDGRTMAVNKPPEVSFFRSLKGRCRGNRFCGQNWAPVYTFLTRVRVPSARSRRTARSATTDLLIEVFYQ